MSGQNGPSRGGGFDVLGNETRRRILEALAERLRELPGDPALGFSELRRRVGVRDSGNFNYHLSKLRGRFVTKGDGGYRLAPAGLEVVTALITGVYGSDVELGPLELEEPCPTCGAPLTAAYEEGLLRVACRNDHPFQNALAPGAVADRSLAAVIDVWTLKTRHDLAKTVEGVCPFCYAPVDAAASVEPFDGLPEVSARCSRCGVQVSIPVIVAFVRHPTVAAFYHEHGTDVRTRPLWAPEFYDPVDVAADPDADRFCVTVELDGETVEGSVDDSLSVVDVTR